MRRRGRRRGPPYIVPAISGLFAPHWRSEARWIVVGLRVDGGMTADNLLMRFLADVLNVPVVRPIVADTVSLGAAVALRTLSRF
jgi:glycerol kinase